MHRTTLTALSLGLALAVLAARAGAVQGTITGHFEPASVKPFHVRGPVWLLTGAACNIVVSVGPDGVLVVDTGVAQDSALVLSAIAQLQERLATSGAPELGFGSETRSALERARVTPAPPKPIRYILNTSADLDHTGGNENIARAGAATIGHNMARDLGNAPETAAIYAHENVLNRMLEAGRNVPAAALPRYPYRSEFYKLQPYVNGEGIELVYRPAAHTDGDSMIWFRTSDVVAVGELFSTTSYPVIDIAKGGTVQGELAALNAILDLAFPEYVHQGGTMIIPAHGRVSDYADVAYYRDMVTIVRDRIQDSIKKGLTLPQIKASRPTEDYDTRYASPEGGSKADAFVESVYKSLTAAR